MLRKTGLIFILIILAVAPLAFRSSEFEWAGEGRKQSKTILRLKFENKYPKTIPGQCEVYQK